jgi:hypothetical protein
MKLVTKAYATITWLNTIASKFNINRRRTLATQYVLSLIDYSLISIFPFLSKTNKNKLNTIISKTARFILQTPQSTPTQYVIIEATLQNIHDRTLYLALQFYKTHLHHPNPLCKALSNSHQLQNILTDLPEDTHAVQTTLKLLKHKLRNRAVEALAQEKPKLAHYIDHPQPTLTRTSPLMARLRTGHGLTNEWLHRLTLIPPTPCRLCEMESESVSHLLVLCPHPVASTARKHTIYKIRGLTGKTPEEQINLLLTRAPPPQVQKVKENLLLAYFKALNIKL